MKIQQRHVQIFIGWEGDPGLTTTDLNHTATAPYTMLHKQKIASHYTTLRQSVNNKGDFEPP